MLLTRHICAPRSHRNSIISCKKLRRVFHYRPANLSYVECWLKSGLARKIAADWHQSRRAPTAASPTFNCSTLLLLRPPSAKAAACLPIKRRKIAKRKLIGGKFDVLASAPARKQMTNAVTMITLLVAVAVFRRAGRARGERIIIRLALQLATGTGTFFTALTACLMLLTIICSFVSD